MEYYAVRSPDHFPFVSGFYALRAGVCAGMLADRSAMLQRQDSETVVVAAMPMPAPMGRARQQPSGDKEQSRPPRSAPAPGSSDAPRPSRRPLILIVDDAPDARDMYGLYFEHRGFRVATARNGLEGVEKAVQLKPDVIVMDLAMPVMDGWEATRRIKTNAQTAHIPVVALTGRSMLRAAEQALLAGCNGFVLKPCLPQDLHTTLGRFLSRGR